MRKIFLVPAYLAVFVSIGGGGVAAASGPEGVVCDSVTRAAASNAILSNAASNGTASLSEEYRGAIEAAVANIYEDPAPFRIPGYIADNSLDKVISRYGTNPLISAFRQNYAVAKYQCDNEKPYVGGGNILAGNLMEQGTDGSTNMIYKGYDIYASVVVSRS